LITVNEFGFVRFFHAGLGCYRRCILEVSRFDNATIDSLIEVMSILHSSNGPTERILHEHY